MDNENKKKILYIVAFIVIVFIGLIAFLLLRDTQAGKYYGDFKKLSIDNKFAVSGDYNECDNKKSCIEKSITLIRDGLIMEGYFIGYDKGSIDKDIDNINSQVGKKNYKNAYTDTEALIKKIYNQTQDYLNENKNNFSAIKAVVKKSLGEANFSELFVTNYRIINNWAVVTVTTNNSGIDPANVVLVRHDTWTILAGPDTYLDVYSPKLLSAPQQIKDNLNSYYPIAFITDAGTLNSEFSARSYTNTAETEKLLALVPYYNDIFTVSMVRKNNLNTFLVVTGDEHKKDINKFFTNWLKANKVDPNGLIYEFRFDNQTQKGVNYDQSR